MKKTQLTIALMGSLAVTSAFAFDSNDIYTSVDNYSIATNKLINDDSTKEAFNNNNAQTTLGSALNLQYAKPLKVAGGYTAQKIEKVIPSQEAEIQRLKYKKEAKKNKSLWTRLQVAANLEKAKGILNLMKAAEAKASENGNTEYYNDIISRITPMQADITSGFNKLSESQLNNAHFKAAIASAKNKDFLGYRSNMVEFWKDRVSFLDNAYTTPVTKGSAEDFNATANYALIEALAAKDGSTITEASSEYANANKLAYAITSLNIDNNYVIKQFNKYNAQPASMLQQSCTVNYSDAVVSDKYVQANETLNNLTDGKFVLSNISTILKKNGLNFDINLDKKIPGYKKIRQGLAIIGIKLPAIINTDDLANFDYINDYVGETIANQAIYKEAVNGNNVIFNKATSVAPCSMTSLANLETAAQQDDQTVAKGLVAAVNHYADVIAKDSGTEVDEATKLKVYQIISKDLYGQVANLANK